MPRSRPEGEGRPKAYLSREGRRAANLVEEAVLDLLPENLAG